MFHSFRLPRSWRAHSQHHGHKIACKHHRYAYPYAAAEAESCKAGVGARPDRFPHSKSRILLRASRRGSDALFRFDKGGNSPYSHGHAIEHHHCTTHHRAHASSGEQGRKQGTRENTYKETGIKNHKRQDKEYEDHSLQRIFHACTHLRGILCRQEHTAPSRLGTVQPHSGGHSCHYNLSAVHGHTLRDIQ